MALGTPVWSARTLFVRVKVRPSFDVASMRRVAHGPRPRALPGGVPRPSAGLRSLTRSFASAGLFFDPAGWAAVAGGRRGEKPRPRTQTSTAAFGGVAFMKLDGGIYPQVASEIPSPAAACAHLTWVVPETGRRVASRRGKVLGLGDAVTCRRFSCLANLYVFSPLASSPSPPAEGGDGWGEEGVLLGGASVYPRWDAPLPVRSSRGEGVL